MTFWLIFINFSSLHAILEEEGDDKKKGSENSKDDKKEDEKKNLEEPPKIGMFSLPQSQQPSALFGFGGNIIEENEFQMTFFVDEFSGPTRRIIDVIPGFLFGVNERLSVYFNFPVTPEFMDGCNKSAGFEDFLVQLEYAIYDKTTTCYSDQVTLVGNVTVPTGSIKKNPPTGFGSPSFFIGGTYYRTTIDWIFFTAQGAIITTSDHRTKIGDQFLYQWGFTRRVTSPEGWIFAWMLELDGQYYRKNRIHGKIDHNSGGNIFLVTPSLWASSKDMVAQFGISIPVNQNFYGRQGKFDFVLNFNFAWSFY